MKIGLIGAGNIGRTLGEKWASAGHEILYGVRNPEDAKYSSLHGRLGAPQEAAEFGDVITLALPGAAVPAFAEDNRSVLEGKLIVDTTNNVRKPVMHSLDILRQAVPDARLVRAFNSLGWENFADPEIEGVKIDHFFCGSPDVRVQAERLIADIGLRPVYIGGIEKAQVLDGLTRLWFALVSEGDYSRHTAFKLLTSPY